MSILTIWAYYSLSNSSKNSNINKPKKTII